MLTNRSKRLEWALTEFSRAEKCYPVRSWRGPPGCAGRRIGTGQVCSAGGRGDADALRKPGGGGGGDSRKCVGRRSSSGRRHRIAPLLQSAPSSRKSPTRKCGIPIPCPTRVPVRPIARCRATFSIRRPK